jgi:programmed cell death 6-interacting protein
MDYEKINLSIANDPKSSEDLERNLIAYLRYLYLLQKRFTFDANQPRAINMTFIWSDSYNHTRSAALPSIKLEIASSFYNLAIAEYY